MTAFDEYLRGTERMVTPGPIENYLAQKNSVGRIVAPIQPSTMAFGSPSVTDWLSQNWPWVAIGGLAVFALASK